MRVEKEQGLINSVIVAELVQDMLSRFETKETVTIGTFTNCRECGYTFKVFKHNGDSFTWCVYEHRNSDQIIINGKEGYISMNGQLPYAANSKYDYLASFSYNNHYGCAEKLSEMIKEFIE